MVSPPALPPAAPFPETAPLPYSTSVLHICSIAGMLVSLVVALLLLVLLLLLAFVARDDKPVRILGVSFLAYLLVGCLVGQGFLLAHAQESYTQATQAASSTMSTWAECHTQTMLPLLFFSLLSAPLMAKLWRMWSKIRGAETHQLQLDIPPPICYNV